MPQNITTFPIVAKRVSDLPVSKPVATTRILHSTTDLFSSSSIPAFAESLLLFSSTDLVVNPTSPVSLNLPTDKHVQLLRVATPTVIDIRAAQSYLIGNETGSAASLTINSLDIPSGSVLATTILSPGQAVFATWDASANVHRFITMGGSAPVSGYVKPVQTADFTATAGQVVPHLWPVDVRGNAAVSTLLVTAPAAPVVGDMFSVSDIALACDTDRTIRIQFPTALLMSVLGPADYAEINSAGAKITFTYVSPAVGWELAANVNN